MYILGEKKIWDKKERVSERSGLGKGDAYYIRSLRSPENIWCSFVENWIPHIKYVQKSWIIGYNEGAWN